MTMVESSDGEIEETQVFGFYESRMFGMGPVLLVSSEISGGHCGGCSVARIGQIPRRGDRRTRGIREGNQFGGAMRLHPL